MPSPPRAAALKGRAAQAVLVVFAVAAGLPDLLLPRQDFPQARPCVVRTQHVKPRPQIVEREPEHRAAVLHLPAPGDGLGTGPHEPVPFDIAPGGGAGPEPPVVDVGAHGRIALDQTRSGEPVHDGLGVFFGSKTVPDGVEIEERETVVVCMAVFVDDRMESPGFGIPEQAVGLGLHVVGMLAQRAGVEREFAAGDVPFGMGTDRVFELSHDPQRRIILVRRVEVVPAEGQEVPVIAADALSVMDGLRSVGAELQPGDAGMADPLVADAVMGEAAQGGLLVAEGLAHVVDDGAQEGQVAAPPVVVPARHDVDRIVDGVPRIVDGKKRVDGEFAAGFAGGQRNADAFDLAVPLGMRVHGNHGMGRTRDAFVIGIARVKTKMDAPFGAEGRVFLAHPLDIRQLARCGRAGPCPPQLQKRRVERDDARTFRRHQHGRRPGRGQMPFPLDNAPGFAMDELPAVQRLFPGERGLGLPAERVPDPAGAVLLKMPARAKALGLRRPLRPHGKRPALLVSVREMLVCPDVPVGIKPHREEIVALDVLHGRGQPGCIAPPIHWSDVVRYSLLNSTGECPSRR